MELKCQGLGDGFRKGHQKPKALYWMHAHALISTFWCRPKRWGAESPQRPHWSPNQKPSLPVQLFMGTQSSDCIWSDFCGAASLQGFSLCHRTSTSVRGFLMQKSILVACYSGIKENCLYSWEYIFDKKRSKGFHEEELPAHTLFSTLFSLRFFFFVLFGGDTGQDRPSCLALALIEPCQDFLCCLLRLERIRPAQILPASLLFLIYCHGYLSQVFAALLCGPWIIYNFLMAHNHVNWKLSLPLT